MPRRLAKRVSVGEWFQAVRRLGHRWRPTGIFVVASQIVLAVATWVISNWVSGDTASPGFFGVTFFGVTLVYLVLAHGVVLALLIDRNASTRSAIAVSLKRAASQLATTLIIGALIFAGAFVISLPFLFPLAMSPGDTSFATNVAVVLLFSVIPVFVGSRFLAVLPLVVRGRGLGAIGEAWRRSRHAGWPGRLGVILILLVLASTSYFSRLVGPGTLRVVVVQIGWTLVIFAGALFEEGFQEVTSAESEEASAT